VRDIPLTSTVFSGDRNYLVLHDFIFVYYESIKRDLKRRLIYEYRYDERLKTKNEESTLLTDTGLILLFIINKWVGLRLYVKAE
jgi:hypothetical protein